MPTLSWLAVLLKVECGGWRGHTSIPEATVLALVPLTCAPRMAACLSPPSKVSPRHQVGGIGLKERDVPFDVKDWKKRWLRWDKRS